MSLDAPHLDVTASGRPPHAAALAPDPEPGTLTFRALVSIDDAHACAALQRETWGDAFTDRVPGSLLRVFLDIGGVALGAFTPDGQLVGFVFGFPGLVDGVPIHWSHMLAVRVSVQRLGIGRRLKELQREELARRGITRMRWTFDPLQARNAHLNLNRLGARVLDYVANMYGVTGSPLHHGLTTDRLVVECLTTTRREPITPVAPSAIARAPVLSTVPRPGDVRLDAAPDRSLPPVVLIEIPADLQEVAASAPQWRTTTREHFQWALRHGYDVTRLHRDPVTSRTCYVLVQRSAVPLVLAAVP